MVKREASLYDQMFMISNKIQNNNLFMRKIVVLQIVAFYLFSCQVTYAQSQRYKGYPKKDTDIFSEFANPPKGYGNVPFYCGMVIV